MTDWHLVKSDPLTDESMIIATNTKCVGEAWFSLSDRKWYWQSGDPVLGAVEYWMPLPEPPQR